MGGSVGNLIAREPLATTTSGSQRKDENPYPMPIEKEGHP
jgi:hypothetical protein